MFDLKIDTDKYDATLSNSKVCCDNWEHVIEYNKQLHDSGPKSDFQSHNNSSS